MNDISGNSSAKLEREKEKEFVRKRHEQRDPIEDIPYLILAVGCMVAAVVGFCIWYPSEKIYNFVKKKYDK